MGDKSGFRNEYISQICPSLFAQVRLYNDSDAKERSPLLLMALNSPEIASIGAQSNLVTGRDLRGWKCQCQAFNPGP